MRGFDAAFTGSSVEMLDHTGSEAQVHVERWSGRASTDDQAQMVRDVLRSLGQPKVAEPA